MRPHPLALLCLGFIAAAGIGAAVLPASGAAPPRVEYNRDIRPILSDKCFACHGPDAAQRKADLRLDTGGEARTREVLAPGNPAKSRFLARLTAPQPALRMPPASTGKALSGGEIALLTQWIAQGAVYQSHWAYLPPRRPPLPPVKDAAWVRNPVDRFILAKIEAAGLRPAPEADRATLIRRLSFDLTGLPPTSAETDAFLADRSSEAYEKVVDRLLASPRYGERMAMYWLDLVRYADTVGYHGDQEHHISPYRDWVIKAFADDMPFDRFTTEQLAGDLLPDPTVNQRIATGYNRLLQTTHEGGAQDKEYRAKYAADRVRNLSGAWMGATLGCAECHDHKFDPYTQKDFYSLAAFFADIQEHGAYPGPDRNPTVREPEIEVLSPFDQEEAAGLRAQIARMEAQGGGGDAASLRARLAEVEKRKRRTMVTVSVPAREIRVLRRGDWMDESGPVVTPAVPHFLPQVRVSGRPTRLDLSRWLTSPENPQTARVFVNRMWYLLFGAGLCRSLEDFGAQGEWPTHPELLDYLAARFAGVPGPGSRVPSRSGAGAAGASEDGLGWSVKELVRLLVTSGAYRQASNPNSKIQDSKSNVFFAQQGRFRLPAEMIRDNALAVSGLLVERQGGPSARPYQPDGYYALLNFPKRTYQNDKDDNQYRRGVYVHWQRQYLHPMLRAFDAPTREECTAQRPITNTPLAALTLLNDPTFTEAARALAAQTMREGGADEDARVRWVWRVVLTRAPQDREVEVLKRLYRRNREQYQADPEAAKRLLQVGMVPVPDGLQPAELAAWTAVSRALLNLSETITRN